MNDDTEIVRGKSPVLLTKKMKREQNAFEKLLAMNNSAAVLYKQGLANNGGILARCIHVAGPQWFYFAVGGKINCVCVRKYFCG